MHRFLNTALGGYVRSVNSYSAGASAVILPHILGSLDAVSRHGVTWDQIAAHSEVVVAFGGMALKNSAIAAGGVSQHVDRGAMRAAQSRSARFVLISPLRDDLPEEARADWLPVVPNTDTALMLGVAHTLVAENLHDRAFLERFCVGYSMFEDYLLGRSDGQPKDAGWAAAICGLPADEIVALARGMAGRRTLVVVAHALQRAEYGEQPVWMGWRRATTLYETSFRLRASRTCCCNLARCSITTVSVSHIPRSAWCTGPVATHFTIIRT
jgi:biotin/methionine sulfoxide reductase